MADKSEQTAEALLPLLGGAGNIAAVENCMTRMRVTPVDPDVIDVAAVKKVPGVLGVVEDETFQIVLGPGAVTKVTTAFRKLLGGAGGGDAKVLADKGAAIKAAQKKRNDTPLKNVLRKIANIFVPLIPALIGAGLVAAIRGLLANWVEVGTAPEWVVSLLPSLTAIGTAFFAFLAIFAGINAAKEFGGTPALGGAVAAIIVFPGVSEISYTLPGIGLVELSPGQGGVIGAIFAAGLCAWIERLLRGKIPDAVDILVTPTVALLVSGLATIYVFMFVADWIATGIGNGADWLLEYSGVVAGFVLGGLFLPLVMLGLHQALIPIHMALIEQTGYTSLLTILAMAGAGQVGAAIAIYLKLRKNRALRDTIKGATPVGILGVGEPLIYGVTLPLGRPFITACLGGAVGGAVAGAFDQFIAPFGATAIGPSGWALVPLLESSNGQGYAIMAYVVGLAAGYLAGFFFTYLWGFTPALMEEHNRSDDEYSELEDDGLVAADPDPDSGPDADSDASPAGGGGVAAAGALTAVKVGLAAPVAGEVIPLSEVPDKMFSAGTMGQGFAVQPTDGTFTSPVAGEIAMIFPTKHAFAVTTPDGVQVLVHIGLETVALKGDGFEVLAAKGDHVEAGDPVIRANLDAIRPKVPSLVTPVIVMNSKEFDVSAPSSDPDGPVVEVTSKTE